MRPEASDEHGKVLDQRLAARQVDAVDLRRFHRPALQAVHVVQPPDPPVQRIDEAPLVLATRPGRDDRIEGAVDLAIKR